DDKTRNKGRGESGLPKLPDRKDKNRMSTRTRPQGWLPHVELVARRIAWFHKEGKAWALVGDPRPTRPPLSLSPAFLAQCFFMFDTDALCMIASTFGPGSGCILIKPSARSHWRVLPLSLSRKLSA